MASRRYYRCPNCRKRMIGWRSRAGIEHFVCFGPPPCGNNEKPTAAARPPLGPPDFQVGPNLARLIREELALNPDPVSTSPVPDGHGRRFHRERVPPAPGPWSLGWLAAAILAVLLGSALLQLGPFAPLPSASSTGPGAPLRQVEDYGGGGPQFNGYRVVCRDGWISHSGGRPGACSHHGGVAHPAP